jgi:hypothetical protein
MTDAKNRGPLVRPWFRMWSTVIFVVLLPFVVHAVWDYVESRRLAGLLAEIARRGEPVYQRFDRPEGQAAEAERDYRAAAALASAFRTDTQAGLGGAAAAARADSWPAGLAADLRRALHDHEETLALADRAAELPFTGFAPGTAYSYRAANLMDVQQLSGYRAMARALDGDAQGAVDSLYTEARVGRALEGFAFSRSLKASDIVQVLERTRPSTAALARLQTALSDTDNDQELSRWFVGLRVDLLRDWRDRGDAWPQVIAQPWNMHVLNRQLETFSSLMEAAREPWPQRIDHVIAVGTLPGAVTPHVEPRAALEGFVLAATSRVAGFRCVRVVVALEQYRRDHGEQLPDTLENLVPAYVSSIPIDPFSGGPLLLHKEAHGYSVYSVGRNRRDDGAKDVDGTFEVVFPKNDPADVGVRVQYR